MNFEREAIPSTSAELCTRYAAWFCLRTQLKHEHIAAAHLRWLPGVEEVFNPQLRLLRTTRRGRRWSTESLFPNYLFARFVLESAIEKVIYTPGVRHVLRFGDQVPEVPDAVIENLRQELTELGPEVLADAPLEGEEIEITEGAFAGTTAVVTQVLPGKQRARVLIDVMGRSVPAELSLGLVLFNRRDAAEIAQKKVAEIAFERAETIAAEVTDLPVAAGNSRNAEGRAIRVTVNRDD